MSRPFSLSVISILAVSYGALSLLPKILFLVRSGYTEWNGEFMQTLLSNGPIPLPLWLHVLHGVIGSLIWMVAGVYLWRGRSWSRALMLIWGLTVLLLTFAVYAYSGPFLWKCGTYLSLLYFLSNRGAREYLGVGVASKNA